MAHTLRRPLSILCKNAAIRRCAAPSVTMATLNHRVVPIVSMSRFPRQPLLQSRFYRIQGQQPLPKVKPTKAQVEERVLKAVKTFDRLPQDKPLLLDTHFMNDLGLDSLDHVEIVMAVEQEFGLEIPDESAEKLVTPKLLIEYVCKEEQVSQ